MMQSFRLETENPKGDVLLVELSFGRLKMRGSYTTHSALLGAGLNCGDVTEEDGYPGRPVLGETPVRRSFPTAVPSWSVPGHRGHQASWSRPWPASRPWVEPPQGIPGDDTALNGIRLHCTRGNAKQNTHVVESQSGSWGSWSEPLWCPGTHFLVAFSLRVEPFSFPGDNTSVNNVRFRCSDGVELEGPGLSWGDYGDWSNSCAKGVCGLQTKIQKPRGPRDDTGLNDVRIFCCNS
ncbi:vitelline membrane outer layer protein 1 homolog isoform X1 [Peromyscus californicus insignis]|uniref:vitelline membrane outer layer protein 1 homolog isoform X1 n=1 Tax=Peromyscus californicus insignis TaxID=564181 RepID=UPI0022A66DDF|nr:vitelline membrane outer layer protein 1 homolog isoform X1 [Peromyscus californicus insignis]